MKASLPLLCYMALSHAQAQHIPAGVYMNRSSPAPDEQEWERIKKTGDLQKLQSFQERYPNSRLATKVARRIGELRTVEAAADGPAMVLEPSCGNGATEASGHCGNVVRATSLTASRRRSEDPTEQAIRATAGKVRLTLQDPIQIEGSRARAVASDGEKGFYTLEFENTATGWVIRRKTAVELP